LKTFHAIAPFLSNSRAYLLIFPREGIKEECKRVLVVPWCQKSGLFIEMKWFSPSGVTILGWQFCCETFAAIGFL
jgi:hypothetical protein